jgi:NAD(P)-dependent dehydrogenase (short-subunit alcohol dehydrogenase family)
MRNDRTSLDLEGCVILITGAARGLGRAYANLLARHGAHIAVHDAGVNLEGSSVVDPMLAEQATDALLADGLSAAAFNILLNGAFSCRRLIYDVVERFGRLDALVHNAGIVSWRDPAQDLRAIITSEQ